MRTTALLPPRRRSLVLVAPRLMMALPYLLGMSGATALVTAVVVRLFFRRGRGYLDTRVRRR